MSSPYGPMGGIIDMIGNAPKKLLSPLEHVQIPSWLPGGQQPNQHEFGVQQMNQQLNAHRNDAANQSFQPKGGVLTQAAKRPR